MLSRSFFILIGIVLLALEPCLPPTPVSGVQKTDLSASCPMKGLCGMACCCSAKAKPSVCAGTLPAGLYAAGCVPLNGKAFYFSASVSKWMPRSRFWEPAGLPSRRIILSDSLFSFQTQPLAPPPKA